MITNTINVGGMSCGHCKARVEGALQELSGVNSAVVNLEQGSVEVNYDEGSVDLSSLKSAIGEAGYEPVA